MESLSYSPGHITGFFVICDEDNDPLHKGSMGAGIVTSKGVKTSVRIKESDKRELSIFINNVPEDYPVSKYVVDKLAKGNLKIEVRHVLDVPRGVGFGTSGACALSLSLALNDALGLGYSYNYLAQIAHRAEIANMSGLGDVIAETTHGFEIRVSPGAPAVGKVDHIPDERYKVICACLSPLDTKRIITDPLHKENINKFGLKSLENLKRKKTVDKFMELSRNFAFSIGLMSKEVFEIIKKMEENGFMASMAMLGNTVFVVSRDLDAIPLLKGYNLVVTNVSRYGARLL
ncbi:MAG: pantoate kinase [Candidatus Hydrothermarchaeota archaeon]